MMSRAVLKEYLYLLFAIVAGLVISFFLNTNLFFGDSTIDFNVYDTYYVISAHYVWMALALFCIFLLFSARTIFSGIETRLGKFILIISGILVILCLTKINDIAIAMKGLMIDSFEDSPSEQIKIVREINSIWDAASHVVVFLQFLVLVLLIFSVYRFTKATRM